MVSCNLLGSWIKHGQICCLSAFVCYILKGDYLSSHHGYIWINSKTVNQRDIEAITVSIKDNTKT